MRRSRFALTLWLMSSTAALAQAPPSTIRVIVPNAPGGAMDILLRILADRIQTRRGVTVLIDNRPGASTIIGSDIAARAAPDGSVLLAAANSFVINPQLRPLPYDPLTSFVGICELVEIPVVVAVNAQSSYRTLADLIADARAKPGRLTIGSNGPATGQHVFAEILRRSTGLDVVYVPYSGGPAAVNALLGGQINAMTASLSDLDAQLEGGQVRVLASSLDARSPLAPDVPTFRESGVDVEMPSWVSVHAPAKTPAPIVATLQTWFAEALAEPAVRQRLASMEMSAAPICGAPFDAFLRAQYELIGRTIREAGIKE